MDYIISVVILLGVLVAIHEFGHFIIAKAFGVRVETFSIGMGKKILSFTRGETEYTISLIPLGGYVKLTGQDPREEVPPELEHRSFRTKPLYQRTAVVLAGPIFNAVLAVLVMIGLFSHGMPVPTAQIARVLPGSRAESAGFRSGDEVVSINRAGETIKVREYSDLEKVVSSSIGQELSFQIQRTKANDPTQKESLNLAFAPVMGWDRDSTLGVLSQRGVIEGVERSAPAPVVVPVAKSWAASKQIPFGFWISELSWQSAGATQSAKLETFSDLVQAWAQALAAQSSAERGAITLVGHKIMIESPDAKSASTAAPEELRFTLDWLRAKDRPTADLASAGLASSELFVIDVKEGSPAQKLGLLKGDQIRSVNGEKALSFSNFRELIQRHAAAGQSLKIEWLRENQTMVAEIRPEVVSTRDPLTEAKKEQFQIGTAFMALQAAPTTYMLKAEGFGEAISLGFNKTVVLTTTMLKSFYLLATGEISPKTLGGPILIGKIAGESFRQGWVAFFRTMAFISLNLFILNLFPIPVLDGGHLVLFAIEAIRRRPLSIKIIEMWTTAGFFLLMSLVAVVFFNDLSRLGLFRFLNL